MGHATTAISSDLAALIERPHAGLARRWRAAGEGDTKAVHRARVATRRLREALAVADGAALDGHVGRARRAVRKITRALGPVREMDVAIAELARAARRHRWPPDVVRIIGRRLEDARAERARRMSRQLGKVERGRVRADVKDLAKRLAHADERAWQGALTARVAERARAVLAAASEAGTIYAPERLHVLRIAIKKLRYAVELLPPSSTFDRTAVIQALKRAQRRFGALHDLQGLSAEVQRIDIVRRPRALRVALTGAVDALERDCREVHARALALVPDVEACARQLRRDLGARRRGRRLAMAKANLDAVAAVRLKA